jgi:hypothetical protein
VNERSVIVFCDAGFLKHKVKGPGNAPLSAKDVKSAVLTAVSKAAAISGEPLRLFRALYYDAPPLGGTVKNPIDGSVFDFSKHALAARGHALLESVEQLPFFAVRRGKLMSHGWEIGPQALKSLQAAPRPVSAKDLRPKVEQKGVDLRIAIDIVETAAKRIADVVLLISADSDLVPAMKFARREGRHVFLSTMGHHVAMDLRSHADLVID